jgi:hypothetical protein
MPRAALIPLAAAVALMGCGTGDDRRQAREAVERMYAAVESRDGAAACEQLTEQAAAALERQTRRPCQEGVLDLELVGMRVARVRVYLTSAEALFVEGDTAFLDRTSRGWRVSAAGCKPRGRRPAECEVTA